MKKIWQSPEIQQRNRLPMRSPLVPYASESEALNECAAGPEGVAFTKSPFAKCLDGEWKFLLQKTADEDENSSYKNWAFPNFDDAAWRNLTVPGTWTLQNTEDHPHYTNVQMPFTTMPPEVPLENPTGLYRLQTEIPAQWKGRRVVLHIGSVESCTLVWINGELCGVSKDTRLPCEFDITNYLEWNGDKCAATIAIKVVRYSDASFLEDQDQWWFGGIHRSVYLYSTERIFIKDVKALTVAVAESSSREDRSRGRCRSSESGVQEQRGVVGGASVQQAEGVQNVGGVQQSKGLEGTGVTGIIPLRIEVGIAGSEKVPLDLAELSKIKIAVKYAVYEMDGVPSKGVAGKKVVEGKIISSLNYRETLDELRADIKIDSPKLWSAEKPNLYIVTVTLCEVGGDGELGREIESTAFTVGFKTVEIKDRKLLLNGKAVYIHGVNRHEHSELHGKTLSTAEMVRDVKLMKAYNFNAVRTCHYPDDERWYEICDRYGIYILDEANIENHAYYDAFSRNDEWCYAYTQRVQRMFRRDKNHACIFGWSLGNESGKGQNHVVNSAWLKSVDKTRIVHYEGFGYNDFTQVHGDVASIGYGKEHTDLVSRMYAPIDWILDYAKNYDDHRPVILCEYNHAMGNANGSLADYWKAIESTPGLQGGFIWDWIDQGIAAELPAGENGKPQGGKYWKYGGDFGDSPSDYDFCLNGLILPDQTPKPAMEECRYLFAPVRMNDVHAAQGIFEIENRYDFSTLENVELNFSILKNGIACKSGVVKIPEIPCGENAQIKIPEITDALANAKESEDVILRAEFVYANDTPFAQKGSLIRRDEFILAQATAARIFANADSQKSPSLVNVPSDEAKNFAANIMPQLFRAVTENEAVKRELPLLEKGETPWSIAGKPTISWLRAGLCDLQTEKINEKEFKLCSPQNAQDKKEFGTFTVSTTPATSPDGNAALKICVTFNLTDALQEYPRAGISVPVPAAFTDVRWYGQGPHECYNDRADSAKLGLWSQKIAALEVPYIVPQENGTRCGTYYVELCGDGKTLHVQSEKPFSFSVLKYTAQDLFKKEHVAELDDLTQDKENPRWIFNIDATHRGVGTGACGPDTLEQYRVRPGVYKLELLVW